MNIYFAGSIRGGRDDRELYSKIIELLQKYGKVLTEHVGDGNLSQLGEALTDEFIYERDMAWIAEADVVVAEISTPSTGVGYELGKVEGVKPLICLWRQRDNRRVSAMMSGNRHLVLREYTDLGDVERILERFFGGLKVSAK